MLFVHNLGVDIGLWTVCLIALGHGGIREWRRLLNPPILAIVGAITLNAVGGERTLPEFVRKRRTCSADVLSPGIVLIGATMADSAGICGALPSPRGVVVAVAPGILPALGFGRGLAGSVTGTEAGAGGPGRHARGGVSPSSWRGIMVATH